MMTRARYTMRVMTKAQTTETLLEALWALNRNTTTEGMLVASMVTDELEARLSEADFLELMGKLEKDLMAA